MQRLRLTVGRSPDATMYMHREACRAPIHLPEMQYWQQTRKADWHWIVMETVSGRSVDFWSTQR